MVLSPNNHKPRIVILTTDNYEQRYVANRLADAFQIQAIFVDKKIYSRKKKSYFRRGIVSFLGKASRILFLKLINTHNTRRKTLVHLLGEMSLTFQDDNLIQPIDGLNTPETYAAIKSYNPDAILVYGTRIVKDNILDIAKDLSFNMHTGISPYYRGTACAFWPVVNNDLNMIGATIHECTSAVDGGEIYAVHHAKLEKGDNIHSAFARSVKVGADAYVKVVDDYMNARLKGQKQDLSIGKEYRGYELTLLPEMKARLNIRKFNQQ